MKVNISTPQYTTANVANLKLFAPNLWQVILKPENYLNYTAGQYLQIIFEQENLSYSIANAPTKAKVYELHFRETNNPLNQHLLSLFKQNQQLKLALPFGHCHLTNIKLDKPILFMAGGTGFAPIKAMIEQLFQSKHQNYIELFRGGRTTKEMYLTDLINQWRQTIKNFNYFPLAADINKETLASLVLNKHPYDLKNWQIVISGPYKMTLPARKIFLDNGLVPEQIFSDAF